MQPQTHEFQSSMADLAGMFVVETELAAVTCDECEAPQLSALMPVLKRLRDAFGMDVAFVGQVRDGHLASREWLDDGCNPFEEAYGRELLRQRCGDAMPVYQDGIESGTLVCGLLAGDGCRPSSESLVSVSRMLATSMRRIAVRVTD